MLIYRKHQPEPSMRQCIIGLLTAYRLALQSAWERGESDAETTPVWAAAFSLISDVQWTQRHPSQQTLEHLYDLLGDRLWEHRP